MVECASWENKHIYYSNNPLMNYGLKLFLQVFYLKMVLIRTSLVAQWLRIHLPMQGTWVRALVWEDPTCHGATKPVRHNY